MWRVDEVNLRRSISEAVEMKIDEEIKEKDRLVKEAGIGILTEGKLNFVR